MESLLVKTLSKIAAHIWLGINIYEDYNEMLVTYTTIESEAEVYMEKHAAILGWD